MMNYKEFKAMTIARIPEYLPEQLRTLQVDVRTTEKVNRTVDSICLTGQEKQNASPAIHINDLYRNYQANGDFEAILEGAAELMAEGMNQIEFVMGGVDFEQAHDRVVFQVVNLEQNEKLLENTPHRPYQDLAILYRVLLHIDERGMQSAIVSEAVAKRMGVSEEELFQLASENTKVWFPPTVQGMSEVLFGELQESGMPEEMLEELIGKRQEEEVMWVISNEARMNGAASILYEESLHSLAERVGTDLYLLPSSVHEVIAVSASYGDPEELAQMVQEINQNEVALEDQLSNQVYHYDKELRRTSMATNTPNKTLDSIACETQGIYIPDEGRGR